LFEFVSFDPLEKIEGVVEYFFYVFIPHACGFDSLKRQEDGRTNILL
jgi:hypothetical protein